MSLVIALLVSTLFFEWPWHLAVIIPAAGLEVFELMLWLRWRKVRSITGKDNLIGAKGRTITACDPKGQARIQGQIWNVSAPQRVEAGTDVIVSAAEGLELVVAPAPDSAVATGSEPRPRAS